MPMTAAMTQEKKPMSHSTQVKRRKMWQRSLTATPLPAPPVMRVTVTGMRRSGNSSKRPRWPRTARAARSLWR
uniref:Alternative protein SSRP1 n=1 Tax=Homo sapiens TaxID=9606 RepID=L8EA29_HUMAN|nr:alternative protein SSRP1 [Homo sapiens]